MQSPKAATVRTMVLGWALYERTRQRNDVVLPGVIVRNIQVMHSHILESRANASLECRAREWRLVLFPPTRSPSNHFFFVRRIVPCFNCFHDFFFPVLQRTAIEKSEQFLVLSLQNTTKNSLRRRSIAGCTLQKHCRNMSVVPIVRRRSPYSRHHEHVSAVTCFCSVVLPARNSHHKKIKVHDVDIRHHPTFRPHIATTGVPFPHFFLALIIIGAFAR